jgi:chloramphenicol-sensitive protein RarD
MNVLLGVVVLKERLPRPVALALLLAGAGVLWLTVESGRPPWISFALALSFGLYGLLRKLVRVGALAGLTVETALLFPLALAYLGVAAARGSLAFFSESFARDLLLVAAGPITAIPLLLFAGATRRLPLSSMGFLQYLSPSLQFLLATFVYREPFTHVQAVAFGLIWTGLLVFAADTVRRRTEEPVMEP